VGRRSSCARGVGALGLVPRLPSADNSQGLAKRLAASGSTGGTNRRLRVFAVTQIAASFVMLAGAGMLLKTLLSLQATETGFDVHHVLAVNVPRCPMDARRNRSMIFLSRDASQDPGAAVWTSVGRDLCAVARQRSFGPGFSFPPTATERAGERIRGRFRGVSPGSSRRLASRSLRGRDIN